MPTDDFKIDAIQPLEITLPGASLPSTDQQASFGQVLSQWVNKTNSVLTDSDQSVQALVDGSLEHPHDAMIKLEQANLALQFTVQVRDKVVDAYNEVMRMQI